MYGRERGFWGILRDYLSQFGINEKIIIMGDLNVKVGGFGKSGFRFNK